MFNQYVRDGNFLVCPPAFRRFTNSLSKDTTTDMSPEMMINAPSLWLHIAYNVYLHESVVIIPPAVRKRISFGQFAMIILFQI